MSLLLFQDVLPIKILAVVVLYNESLYDSLIYGSSIRFLYRFQKYL